MKEYRCLKEGYIFYKEERDMYSASNKIKQRFKISFEYSETLESDTFEGILDALNDLIQKVKSGHLNFKEIEYRGFAVKIWELERGYEANAKSDDRELQILLHHTYIYSDAEKETKLYLDAYLLGQNNERN